MSRNPQDHRTLPTACYRTRKLRGLTGKSLSYQKAPKTKKIAEGIHSAYFERVAYLGSVVHPPQFFLGASRRTAVRCILCEAKFIPLAVASFHTVVLKPWGAPSHYYTHRAGQYCPSPSPPGFPRLLQKRRGLLPALPTVASVANPFINGSKGEGQRPPRGRAL